MSSWQASMDAALRGPYDICVLASYENMIIRFAVKLKIDDVKYSEDLARVPGQRHSRGADIDVRGHAACGYVKTMTS
jgi:hypothetical protein